MAELQSQPIKYIGPYNGTDPNGGNSVEQDLNVYYDHGDIAWMITATALVLLMIPGVGLFYSGLARRKSSLSLIWTSIMATAVVSVQWFFWGYSLTFSHSAGLFIGDLQNIGFRNTLAGPSVGSARLPDLLFAIYQGMFAAITVALGVGAIAERGRTLPCIAFMFLWSTLVYDPIACWNWNTSGWISKWGGIDFAGGTPVHISSGTCALAYSIMLGRRRGNLKYRPQNAPQIILGTVFLWVGWFGFNAGSALGANMRAVMAAVVTNLAACVGGLAWTTVDWYITGKFTTVGFCSGIVAGLVAITPGSGYVPAWAAIIYGICAGVGCNHATKLKDIIGIDDALDIFAIHAVGGFIGNILTGVFAANYIAHLDGYTIISGGWLNYNWMQVVKQFTDSVAGGAYSFVVSLAILWAINKLPYLHLRITDVSELEGIDIGEIGEFAYDFVEAERELDTDVAGINLGQEYESALRKQKRREAERKVREAKENEERFGTGPKGDRKIDTVREAAPQYAKYYEEKNMNPNAYTIRF